MQLLPLFLLITCNMCLASDSAIELRNLVEQDKESAPAQQKLNNKKSESVGWCSVPCWGEPCQSRWPDSWLTKYNRKQEENYRETFPVGGPWDKPGNPLKKCCVEYMRRTSPINCTIATAVPAAVACVLTIGYAATCVGAGIGYVGSMMSNACCGCPSYECLNSYANFYGELCCPFGCDENKPLCCAPDSRNCYSCLVDLGIIALPFGVACLEGGCAACLSNPQCWDVQEAGSTSDEPQSDSEQEA